MFRNAFGLYNDEPRKKIISIININKKTLKKFNQFMENYLNIFLHLKKINYFLLFFFILFNCSYHLTFFEV